MNGRTSIHLNRKDGKTGKKAPVALDPSRSSRPSCSKGSQIGSVDALGIPANYGVVRRLRRHAEAKRLVAIGRNPDGDIIKLSPLAAAAWQQMHAAAARDGIVLLPLSGFRSVARQTRIIRRKLAAGEPIDAILQLVAAPGYSEHHTGRAIDIGAPGDPPLAEHFAKTPAFRWLSRRAGEFKFHLSYPRGNRHRIAYEPWHWCYAK